MKVCLLLTILISGTFLFSCSSDISSGNKASFYEFEKFADENKWVFKRDEMTRKFQEARKALGYDFKKELFRMAGNDMERIYWCGLFLITDDFLHGSKPMPELASELFGLGLSIETDPASMDDDEISRAEYQVSMKVFAAVLSYQLGDEDKAKKLKSELEGLFEKYPYYTSSFPAMTEEDRMIYEEL